ncbi:hypothetical protein BU16DRAFT_532752 [Lophium mytilinum]|uniref:Uncharacterized protein n=1 Tax=Lophium mytilinum TaxID=390894 RepID=A0A6A6RF70_9PEZI|nr:hypothetical protein BU16DRAFT_532752 [Lophium mytilinum]
MASSASSPSVHQPPGRFGSGQPATLPPTTHNCTAGAKQIGGAGVRPRPARAMPHRPPERPRTKPQRVPGKDHRRRRFELPDRRAPFKTPRASCKKIAPGVDAQAEWPCKGFEHGTVTAPAR